MIVEVRTYYYTIHHTVPYTTHTLGVHGCFFVARVRDAVCNFSIYSSGANSYIIMLHTGITHALQNNNHGPMPYTTTIQNYHARMTLLPPPRSRMAAYYYDDVLVRSMYYDYYVILLQYNKIVLHTITY